MSKVRFGGETVDLDRRSEPISHVSFQSLMDEEGPDKPHFAFARVRSRDGADEYRHLYSAANIVEWFPLQGRTDPCTRGEIDRIEYFLYLKGEGDAVHVGDVHGEGGDSDAPASKSADYLIWSLTAEDEPSRMMALMAVAFLQHLGVDSVTADDAFDTSDVSNVSPRSEKDPERRAIQRSNGERLLRYVRARVSRLAASGEIECSDPEMLLTSMAQDASRHLAEVLVSQDPNVDEDGDDYAGMPHIRQNAFAAAIMKRFVYDDGSNAAHGPGAVVSAGPGGDPPRARRRSI